MSEQTCEGAMAPYGEAPASNAAGWCEAAWRDVAAAILTQARNRFCAAPAGCRQPCIDRTAATLAGLNDHTLADIGIHRSQIRSFARAVADRPHVDPRGGVP